MKEQALEVLLLAARPYRKGQYSQFTAHVMQHIKDGKTFELTLHRRPKRRMSLIYQLRARKVALSLFAVLLLGTVGFSGYAYATGTDPATLLKRIVVVERQVVGEDVHVNYDGREFRYGKSLTYSDAAVTAYAEQSTIEILARRAENAFTIPRNGVEHVSDPFNRMYVYPWVGVVEKADSGSVTIRKQYMPGNRKAGDLPQNYNELVTLPVDDATMFIEGAKTNFAPNVTGQLVKVHQSNYTRHWTRSGKKPVQVSHYFVFALTHSLAEIKESNETGEYNFQEQDLMPLYESYSGDDNDVTGDVCANNGADRCDKDKFAGKGGANLYNNAPEGYGNGGGYSDSLQYVNPDVMPFGEMVPDNKRPAGIITRHVEGKITRITDADITIRASSGASWTFAYTASQQEAFKKRRAGAGLKVGDQLAATIIESVYNLDNRNIDTRHIYQIKKY